MGSISLMFLVVSKQKKPCHSYDQGFSDLRGLITLYMSATWERRVALGTHCRVQPGEPKKDTVTRTTPSSMPHRTVLRNDLPQPFNDRLGILVFSKGRKFPDISVQNLEIVMGAP